jgi:hypothetical protein
LTSSGRSNQPWWAGNGFWSLLSLLAGLAVAQADIPLADWLTQWALPTVGVLLLTRVVWAGWRWFRGLSSPWRVSKNDRNNFASQTYWSAVSLLVGAASPQLAPLITRLSFRWAVGVAVALFAVALAGEVVAQLRRRTELPTWRSYDGNPYPLLRPYPATHAKVFFGREAEVANLLQLVGNDGPWQQRFIPIIGRSGCGKSSLVRGGLLPKLTRRTLRPWARVKVLDPYVPGDTPVTALADAVYLGPPDKRWQFVDQLNREATQATEAAAGGAKLPIPTNLLEMLSKRRGWHPRLLLVVDQLEELVRGQQLTGETDAQVVTQPLLCLLKAALQADDQLTIIATVRSDLLGLLLADPTVDLFDHPLNIKPMNQEQLRMVITQPAKAARVDLEDGLDLEMLTLSEGVDRLPMLSFVLHHLWAGPAKQDGLITKSEFRTEWGPDNPISRHAQATVDSLVTGPFAAMPPGEAKTLVLDTLLAAVDLEGREPIRRRFPYADLTPVQKVIVDAFAGGNVGLLSIDAPPGGHATVEVSHEAVLRQWKTLLDHIYANATPLQLRRPLDAQANQWDQKGREPALLLRGSALREAQDWPMLTTGLLGEFIAESTTSSQTQEEREMVVVLEDRERIGRDLHDVVIQRLFTTGLQLQSAARQAGEPELAARLTSLVDELDSTIRDIRGAIFELRQQDSSNPP